MSAPTGHALAGDIPEITGLRTSRADVAQKKPRARKPPIAILGVPFDNVTAGEAIGIIEEMIASRRPHYLVTANVDFLVQASTDVELRRILFEAHLVLCDGTPLVWASRLLGNGLPERVAGADLVPLLIRTAARRQYRLFLLGATPQSSERAVANLKQRHPELIIAGHYAPPFNHLLEMDHEAIKRRIEEAQPDLLLVSFGCPKQEKWIAMHYRALGIPVAAGVGATIDFLAGQVRRAPFWMQRSGMEWLFRLAQEPRRLGGRYARDLWIFGRSILAQWWELQAMAGRVGELENGGSSSETTEEFTTLELPERLDLPAVQTGAFRGEAIGGQGHCLLRGEKVRFIDSTGIGALIRLQKQLQEMGRHLVLINPSAPLKSALQLMHLQEFIPQSKDGVAARSLIKTRAREQSAVTEEHSAKARPVLHWQGEITAANAEHAWNSTQAHLIAAAESSQPEVIIDLAAVRFIDSSGLGLMVRTKKLAQRHGTRLVFTGLQPDVRNVLRLAGLELFLVGHSSGHDSSTKTRNRPT